MMIAETACGMISQPFSGGSGCPGDVAVNPLHRFGGGEGQAAGEQFVERDAQGVEVAARIDGTIHSPGLLGGHVGQRSGDEFRRRRAPGARAEDERQCRNP